MGVIWHLKELNLLDQYMQYIFFIYQICGLLMVSNLFNVSPSPRCGSRVRGSHYSGRVRLESRDSLVCVHAASLPVVQTHDVCHHHQPCFLS